MFAADQFFVGARHPQSFGISNYLTGAVPLPTHLSRSFFKMVLQNHHSFFLLLLPSPKGDAKANG
ncbi:hypothetical protein NIES3275_69350 [Microchaete diplosiphon NIES-3275]|nr:hypothetical protein NIES3275_69350 [Microchaete diplosiphon NIES-3275]